MPRLFQHFSTSTGNEFARVRAGEVEHPREDDLALGFESADPSLQLECWEPAPLLPPSSQPAC